MKRLILAGLAAVAMTVSSPATSEAQVRVSVNVGLPRHGVVYRTYTPRASYNERYHYTYRSGYRGYYARPRVEVVRVYRPAPVVIHGRGYHRVYRHR